MTKTVACLHAHVDPVAAAEFTAYPVLVDDGETDDGFFKCSVTAKQDSTVCALEITPQAHTTTNTNAARILPRADITKSVRMS